MKSYCKLLAEAPASSFHVLDPEKAKRLEGKTMFIPSPLDVAQAIADIPVGETRTTADLRCLLAEGANAETACPAAINKYWKWVAEASEETDPASSDYAVPWWRVLKDGKLSSRLPGGQEGQAAKLRAEGVIVENGSR